MIVSYRNNISFRNYVSQRLSNVSRTEKSRESQNPTFIRYMYTDRTLKDLFSERVYPVHFFLKKELAGKKIMDFGCGRGSLVKSLKAMGANAIGIDVHSYKTLDSQPECFVIGDICNQEIQNRVGNDFDYIYSSHSVFSYPETFEFKLKVFDTLVSLLKKGGKMRLSPVRLPQINMLIEKSEYKNLRISDFKIENDDWFNRQRSPVWVEIEKL